MSVALFFIGLLVGVTGNDSSTTKNSSQPFQKDGTAEYVVTGSIVLGTDVLNADKSTDVTTQSLQLQEGPTEPDVADTVPVTIKTVGGNTTGYNMTAIVHAYQGTHLLVLTAIGAPGSKNAQPYLNVSLVAPRANHTSPAAVSILNPQAPNRRPTTYLTSPSYASSARPPGQTYFQTYQRPYGLTMRRPYYSSSRRPVYTNPRHALYSAKTGTNASYASTTGVVSVPAPAVYQRLLLGIPWYPGHYYYLLYRGTPYPYPQVTPVYPPATHVTVPVYVNLGGIALPDIPVVVDGGADVLPDNAAAGEQPANRVSTVGTTQGTAKKPAVKEDRML